MREIAAFPGGKYDDQVDALSYVAAYRETVIREARRPGLGSSTGPADSQRSQPTKRS